jgi:glyoxylase-like metal-dependent hydrolase (beta-lactamase superfamily II)
VEDRCSAAASGGEEIGMLKVPELDPGRPPQPVRERLWLFAPNRDTQGGSAWWLETPGLVDAGLLIDAPALTQANLAFLRERGPGRIVLTGRDGHGRTRRWQEALGWPVLVQEQEAYLLPGVKALERFSGSLDLAVGLRLLWTPGPTPGACVLLAEADDPATSLLFCGRLISPRAPGEAAALPSSRSFHRGRWQRSLEHLLAWLPPAAPGWLASGAGLGALRGDKLIGPGRAVLERLDRRGLTSAPVF